MIPRFLYYKDMDENLEWLTQNTEDSKSNKGNLTFLTHRVNVTKLQSNKKVATLPHFYINSPPFFSGLSPLSSKKFCTSPSDSFFGRSYPPLIRRGGGQEERGGVPTMWSIVIQKNKTKSKIEEYLNIYDRKLFAKNNV